MEKRAAGNGLFVPWVDDKTVTLAFVLPSNDPQHQRKEDDEGFDSCHGYEYDYTPSKNAFSQKVNKCSQPYVTLEYILLVTIRWLLCMDLVMQHR